MEKEVKEQYSPLAAGRRCRALWAVLGALAVLALVCAFFGIRSLNRRSDVAKTGSTNSGAGDATFTITLVPDGEGVTLDLSGADDCSPTPKRVITIPPPRRILDAVEQVSRLKFRNPPPLYVVSDDQMKAGLLPEWKDAILKNYLNIRKDEASLIQQMEMKELNLVGHYTSGKILLRSPPAPESLSDEAFLKSRHLHKVLAHELTHAVVDQNYGFCRVQSMASDYEYRRVLGFLSETLAESVSEDVCRRTDSWEESDTEPLRINPETVLHKVFPEVDRLETLVMCLQDREQSPCRLFHPGSSAEPGELARLRRMLDGAGEKWPDYILDRAGNGLLDVAKRIAGRLIAEEDQEKTAQWVTLLRSLRHGLGVRLLHRGDIANFYEFSKALECRSWVMGVVYIESTEARDFYLDRVVRRPYVHRDLGECVTFDAEKLAVAEGSGIDMLRHRLAIHRKDTGPGKGAGSGPATVNVTTLWAVRGKAVLQAECSGLSEDEIRRVGALVLEVAKMIGS